MKGYSRDFIVALSMVLGVGIAQNVLSFTLPLLAFEISSTGTGLAIIKGVGFVPNILFAIFIGVINDQIYKRHAFRGYTIGMTLLVALLALAIFMDFISIPALALFMILLNGLAYAIGNTQLTLIRLTVDKEQLADATATTSSVYAIITTIAPALAGFALLQVGHLGVIFGCLLVLISVTFAAFFVNPMETLPKKKPFWSSLTEGWKVFVTNKELVMMTVVIVLTNAAEGAFGTALILKLKTAIQATDFEIGIVMATAGLGAVVTTRFAARLRRYFGYRAAFFWPIWGLALLYLAIILQMPVWALCILSFLEGGLSIFFAIGIWSYRQESTEAEHMGRIAGLTGSIFKLGMPPIIILSGVLSDLGNQSGILIMAASINVGAAMFLVLIAKWGWPGKAVEGN